MANTNNPDQGKKPNKDLNKDRDPMSNPTGGREKQGGDPEREIDRERRERERRDREP